MQPRCAALVGRSNVPHHACGEPPFIEIADAARLSRAALAAPGLRGVALPRPGYLHLIVGLAALAAAAALRQLLAP